ELDHGILFHSVSLSVVGLIVNNQWEALLYFTCRTPDLTITPGLTSINRNFFVSSATQDLTLPANSDSTLIIRNPHQNEGANPRLHLKKVTGKPAHSAPSTATSSTARRTPR
ncbi:MAG: hypothetical protein WC314_17890, partial [Vulcanimicrobiota bacterium]